MRVRLWRRQQNKVFRFANRSTRRDRKLSAAWSQLLSVAGCTFSRGCRSRLSNGWLSGSESWGKAKRIDCYCK